MATLAAHDQENAVRALQVGPGGKPLAAGAKSSSFGAKTPGTRAPKTPFKVPLNDENVFTKGGKGDGGKGSSLLMTTNNKGGKLDASAFVTPAGPRSRAPLGAKTTNAKANAFQTPAPLASSAKTLKASPRLRRPKVKVHQPAVDVESEDDVPEIEYMPPKEVPLLDDMDDYLPRDWDFSVLSGPDAMRGITSTYHNPTEDDGRTRGQRLFEESLERDRKKRDAEFDRVFAAQMAKDDAETRRYFGITEPTRDAPKPTVKATSTVRPATGLSTMRARSAATALAPTDRSTPRFGASTAAARVPTGIVTGRKTSKTPVEPTAARHARHASAVASSKSTIGYAQGRAVRSGSAMRPPLSNVTKPLGPSLSTAKRAGTTTPSFASAHQHQRTVSAAASTRSRPFSRSSSVSTNATLVAPPQTDPFGEETAESVERELELLALQDDMGDDDEWLNSFANQPGAVDPLDEEYADFQLQLPAGL